jgi:hypothetical protein
MKNTFKSLLYFIQSKMRELFKKRIKPIVLFCVNCKKKECPDNPNFYEQGIKRSVKVFCIPYIEHRNVKKT